MSLGENRKMDFNHGTRKQDLWQQRYNSLDHNQNAMSQNHQNALGKIASVPDKGYSAPLAAMRQGSMGKLAVFEERLADRDFLVKTTFGQGDQMLARAQASLALAGYDLGDYGVKGVDGIMGPKSEKAIKEFQAALGLEPTGKVDLETMKALDLVTAKGVMKQEIEALSKPHEQKPIGDRPVQELNQETEKRIAERDNLIKPELQGDKVAKCQASLKLAGYDLGKTGVDGKLGPKTAKAIKEFQREHGLKPTGQLDVETLKALEKATAEGWKVNNFDHAQKIEKFISVAEEELSKGFKEKNGDNKTPYGKWYGLDGQPWCAMFVSWCAEKANLLDTTVPKFASVESGKNWYIKNNRFQSRESGYAPKAGDIIFFKNKKGQNHTGIVLAYDATKNMVYTIEGNSSNSIASRSYKLNNTYIQGYGVNGGTSEGKIPEKSTSGTGLNTR